MKVSIIIPTYKRPLFLKRAIESAFNQTYKNIEVIVVSDNDVNSEYEVDTINIVSEYANKKNFVYLSAIGNQGGCYARNRGLEVASGEYVNFLDDDDVIHSDKIEKQVEIVKKNPGISVVGCCASIINKDGNKYRVEKPIFDKDNILFSELKQNLCTTSINLINIDVCKQVGGFEYIESSQEHLFLIKIFAEKPTFDFVDEELVDIYQHAGPRVSNNSKKPLGTLKLTKIIEGYYDRFNEEQVLELKVARMAQDIRAYSLLKDYKNAFSLLKKRFYMKKDSKNIKLLIIIICNMLGVKK